MLTMHFDFQQWEIRDLLWQTSYLLSIMYSILYMIVKDMNSEYIVAAAFELKHDQCIALKKDLTISPKYSMEISTTIKK